MFKQGIFAISIDLELAWGTFYHGGQIRFKQAYKKQRVIIGELLRLFKRFEICATWAVVGHLFLDSCRRENGKLHPDIVRPKHRWFPQDWFSLDPGTNILQDNLWYGRDIVEMIKQAQPEQEIGSHSFCHPRFSDKGCLKETAESDLAKCVQLAKDAGLDLKTFVFPGNAPGHLDLLAKYGFEAFRAKDDAYCRLEPKIIKKSYLLFSDLLGLKPPVVLPRLIPEQGLVEIPSSMLFRFAYGVSKFIPTGFRCKKAKKGIAAAIKQKRIFHLWFHPSSFAWETEEMFKELAGILSYAGECRAKGELDILPLKEIAGLWRRRE